MQTRDYRDRSNALGNDLETMLDSHPDAFDCLIFKAIRSSAEDVTDGIFTDVVGSAEGSERKIDYADPTPSRARIIPEPGFSFLAFTDGSTDANDGSVEQPIVLLLREQDVPKQSVVTWYEYTSQGMATKEVRMYILESRAFGKAPTVGLKHYCIPMKDEGELL